MKKTLTFFHDPGHGWLKVPFKDLVFLGIVFDITAYSYVSGEWVYLEEDCDAGIYLSAARKAGWNVTWRHSYADSTPIRNYGNYNPYWVLNPIKFGSKVVIDGTEYTVTGEYGKRKRATKWLIRSDSGNEFCLPKTTAYSYCEPPEEFDIPVLEAPGYTPDLFGG